MFEKLKQYYKGHIIVGDIPSDAEAYQWYTNEQNETIGVAKHVLTRKDEDLLSLFLTPVSIEQFQLSHEQRMWQEFLFHNGANELLLSLPKQIKTVRFLHFSFKQGFIERNALEEALSGLLSSQFIVIWKTAQYGVIVETSTTELDATLDPSLFDTLTTDFFVTPNILIGKIHVITPSLQSQFNWEQACLHTAQKYIRKQHIYRIEDILPYLFLESKTKDLAQYILQEVNNDTELLATVRMFLECNMNVSLASKKLYMHRNSIQYRVDKFVEKTGVDIKTFTGAISTYLALLLHETSS